MKELVYGRLLLPAIDRYADKVGFIDGERRRTYADHGERVLRLCRGLADLGVDKSDRFAVMAANSSEFLELYHAAFLGAGVINPLNLRLAGAELAYIVEDSGSEVVFVDAFFAQHFANAMELAEHNPVRSVVLIGDGDVPHDIRYEDLLAAAAPALPAEPEEDDLAVLMYTGGTTGSPKGVALEHRAEVLNLYHIGMVIPFDDEATYLHQTPMFHAASMGGIMGTPASGATTVFMPFFDPGPAMHLIEDRQVTQTMMVPTMIAMLLGHPDFSPHRLRSLRRLTYGASPMPPGLLDRLLSLYPELELTQGYGMTESSSLLTWLDAQDHRTGGSKLASAGRPVAGVALAILDDDGRQVPDGATGEICARAGNFMREYWNKPEATEEAFRGGWYHTGDAGYLDEEGYLYLVDRVKDMIISGGENIYSAEVEGALSKHAAVEQVAVIGIPHETWGEQVHAIVVCVEGVDVESEELQDFTRSLIASYKVPKSIEFRSEPLPLSGALKVLKRELRKPYWEGRQSHVH